MREDRPVSRGVVCSGRIAAMLALAMLCGPAPSSAQTTGTFSGFVSDQSAARLPGATVTASLTGQRLVRAAVTNDQGFFDLQGLPRGTYEVKVELTGFATQVRRDIELTAGANVRLDFALGVGSLAEEVIVAAQATMLESRTATQSTLVDDQRVQDLPMNGRNVVGLAGMFAGVTAIRANQDTSDGRQGPIMSVNGGNQNHNLFTLNGSVFTHFNQTTGFNPPPPDAVQEIRIQTHNFSAEYGHAAGSQVSIVSKAGSNGFHGSAWEFHRNSELNARSFFQTRKPEQKQNQAGASAGGAVIQNKLFWFGAYQRLWDRREAGSVQTVVPTDAQRVGDFTALDDAAEKPGQPDQRSTLRRQLGRAVRREQRHPLHQSRGADAPRSLHPLVANRHGRHAAAVATRSLRVHGAGRLPRQRQEPAERALFRRSQRQPFGVGEPEIRRPIALQRCGPVRPDRHAHRGPTPDQRGDVFLSDVAVGRRRRGAGRAARSRRERRRRSRTAAA